MTDKNTEKKEEFIYFKLGKKRAIYKSQDGKIDLSRFTNKTNGKVSRNDEINLPGVIVAIRNGELIDTKKELHDKIEEKQNIVDVTNRAEERVKHKRDATELLRKLKKEELLERVDITKNPYLIAAMIEQESRGRNVSKRRREDVMKALKAKLETLSKDLKGGQSVMVQYLEETDEQYTVKRDQEGAEEGNDF